MTNKQKYRTLCEQEALPIFQQAFWLDVTAGDEWDVALVEKGGQIVAAMPYTRAIGKLGIIHLGQPPLTQHLGPWLKVQPGKYAKKLGREKDLMQELISKLPSYASYKQNWSWTIQNWLPFYWQGFEQTTGYTYQLQDLTNLETVWDQFETKIRGDIKKSSEREGVKVIQNADLEEFIELNKLVFSRQGMKVPNSAEFIRRLDKVVGERKQRKIFIAKDESGRMHAGLYLIWDSESAYYIMGGGDPALRNSGATSLCMWEAIKFAATVTQRFDFEGSMIEPVERFFRGFGAKQVPYFTVLHTTKGFLRVAKALKAIW